MKIRGLKGRPQLRRSTNQEAQLGSQLEIFVPKQKSLILRLLYFNNKLLGFRNKKKNTYQPTILRLTVLYSTRSYLLELEHLFFKCIYSPKAKFFNARMRIILLTSNDGCKSSVSLLMSTSVASKVESTLLAELTTEACRRTWKEKAFLKNTMTCIASVLVFLTF